MNKQLTSDFNKQIATEILKSEYCTIRNYQCNNRINTKNEGYIFYLIEGNVTIHSHNRGSLIFNIFSPEIFGLELLKGVEMINYIRCVTDAQLAIIKKDKLSEILDTHNLWPQAFENLTAYMKILILAEKKINQPTHRDSIIEYLKYIWGLRPAQRRTTSVFNHILLRTHISRSSIHKILTELEREGLIVMSRGKLVECYLS